MSSTPNDEQIAFQREGDGQRYYCRLDHVPDPLPDPNIYPGVSRITLAQAKNLETSGILSPPIICASDGCGRVLYRGLRIRLTRDLARAETFRIHVDGLFEAEHITAEDMVDHLIRAHRIAAEMAKRRVSSLTPTRPVEFDTGDPL